MQLHIKDNNPREKLFCILFCCVYLGAALVTLALGLPDLLPDGLNHLVLELDDLHVGHHGPVLPVEDVQGLGDVPQP